MEPLFEALNLQISYCYDTALDTTGGYNSWLNGTIEHPYRTIANKAQATDYSNHSSDKWCFAMEAAADAYHMTAHLSAIYKSPYETWYGIKPSIHDLCAWGCIVYVKVPHPKKSEDLSTCGYFMGFTKSRVLIYWLDPSTNQVKHAFNADLMSVGFA
jgi:hypothetical protein